MTALLHRESELSAFSEAVAGLLVGRPAMVTVHGGRGTGKSALLDAMLAALPERGLLLRARCHPSERDFAYGMVRQLFDQLPTGEGPAADLFELIQGPARPDADAAPTHELLLALFRVIQSLAAERPLVLAIDDLTHADAPSLQWFCYLARRLDGLPVLLVATLPAGGSGAPDEPLTELDRLPYARQLHPGPLCSTCTGDFLADFFGEPVDLELAALCHDLSLGNPLVLRELAARLRTAGISPGAPDPDRSRQAGAATLSATVLHWLHEEDPAASELLTQLAVMGPDTDTSVNALLSRRGEVQVQEARRALVEAGLVTDGTPVRFAHCLVREAVLARIDAADRLDLHARGAEVLSRLGAPARHTAEHLIQAGSDWGLEVLRSAGAQAAGSGDHASAARYLRQALGLLDRPDDRSGEPRSEQRSEQNETLYELTVQLGAVELHHDLGACARRAEDMVNAAPDPGRRAEGLLQVAGPALAVTSAGARPFIRVAGELAAAPAPAREPLLRLTALALLSGHRAGLRASARAAAGRGGPDAAAREFYGALAALTAAGGRHPRTARRLAEYATASTGAHVPPAAADRPGGAGAVGAALAFAWTGDVGQAQAVATRIVDTARVTGDHALLALGLLVRSETSRLRRESTLGVRDALDAREAAARVESPALIAAARACAARGLVVLGRLEQAEAMLDGMAVPGDAHPLVKGLALHAEGAVRAARGDHAAALEYFLDCGHQLALRGITNPICLSWRQHAAAAYTALGEHSAAATILADGPAETWAGTGAGAGGATAPAAGAAAGAAGAACEQVRLTPAEQRVVDLVMEGRSSLDVAETLFLSKRTVDTHLGRIYRKLGIRSRHELPAALRAL
ncbi:ATP-binding protein [Streptomyces sp. NPDC048258]|uniref:ATP-binding protein n=1 Tax=Streptomyces sp. NPDC048258 TaxID=3365527 RepID=UPI00371A3DCC